MRRTSYFPLIISIFISLINPVSGQSIKDQRDKVRAAQKLIDLPCESSSSNADLFLLGPFDSPVSVLSQIGCPSGSTLRFTNKSGQVLLSYTDLDQLIQLSQLGTYSHLVITVWSGGSHIAVRAFVLDQRAVTLVLDEATKEYPDVITGFGNGVVIISQAAKGDPEWKITVSDLYLWKQNQLRLAKTVDRSERFLAAAKLMAR